MVRDKIFCFSRRKSGMSRNHRLLLSVSIASMMLLAGIIAATHSHFSVRTDSGNASIEAICPCGAHQNQSSDPAGSGNSDNSRCLTCQLIAQFQAQPETTLEFEFDSMVCFVLNAEVLKVARRRSRSFQGRAPPIV